MTPVRAPLRGLAVLALGVLLQACGSTSTVPGEDGPPADAGRSRPIPPDPVPRNEPRSRYGNPSSYVVFGRRYHVMDSAEGYVERGVASWYGSKFHGRRTSSGEPYDMHAMTAAHKALPLPTYVRVTNLRNGRVAVVRVNDRGPFHDNRLIDLSYAAARKLDIVGHGTGLVEVRALVPGRPVPPARPVQVARAAPPPPLADPRLFLQAGAFADPGNAERLRTRIASIPEARVAVEEVVVQGQRLYRVRVGPLDDVETADRLTARIVGAGMGLPQIVID